VRKHDLAANKLDPDGGRVYAPHRPDKLGECPASDSDAAERLD
jgi:hypothetical protein